jgi:hypothetical protein
MVLFHLSPFKHFKAFYRELWPKLGDGGVREAAYRGG